MSSREVVFSAICSALEECQAGLPEEERLALAQDTVIIGDPPPLDSVTFVMFAVGAEEQVEAAVGREFSMMDIAERLFHTGEQITLSRLTDSVLEAVSDSSADPIASAAP